VRALRRFVPGARFGAGFVQYFGDRFLASAAIPFDAAQGVNVLGPRRACLAGGANPHFVQPIADADDHPRKPGNFLVHILRLRLIVNRGLMHPHKEEVQNYAASASFTVFSTAT